MYMRAKEFHFHDIFVRNIWMYMFFFLGDDDSHTYTHKKQEMVEKEEAKECA